MAESKEGESFFRKVVKFVANPATDWSNIAARDGASSESDLERSELKAMVERKRRNDFVRKREFDVLRRLRREGLSPEQLASLGGSSRLEDSEVRISEVGLRQDIRVKAKIDEIEQQMVGEAMRGSSARRTTGFGSAPTQPLAFQTDSLKAAASANASAINPAAGVAKPAVKPHRADSDLDDDALPPLPPLPAFDVPQSAAPAPVTMGSGMAPLRLATAGSTTRAAKAAVGVTAAATAALVLVPVPAAPLEAIEVSEVVHDPELDEPVIAFANADFDQCEHTLSRLVVQGSDRYEHAETWHVLFDLYRAIGEQAKFESLAFSYAHLFGRSSPQWFSMPRQVADAAAAEDRPLVSHPAGDVGWSSPPTLDNEAVARLRAITLQLPMPWVLDWSPLTHVEIEAASQLTALFQQWARQRVEMRWLSGDSLLTTLSEAAPTGVRDADPAYWMARLEALRLANRPDQFDEAAIDYCVTYEVSPPSWEHAQCVVRISGASLSSTSPSVSVISEVSTSFLESGLQDDAPNAQVAHVELSGQLVGDISAILTRIDKRVGLAPLVSVSCARLIRVDFIAAGDLLNWVLSKRTQKSSVTFTDAHRLVALFFGAMGINEHARVQVRRD